MYEITALILCLIIVVGVLVIAMLINFIPNSPLRSSRAKEMKDFAQSHGLNYTAEESRTLRQKLFGYTKKTNMINGKYHGKNISIYDYRTVTSHSLNARGNESKKYTFVNGGYLRERLSTEDIKKIMDGASTAQEFLKKSDKWRFNIGMFVILTILTICLVFILSAYLQEIGYIILIPIIIMVLVISLYLSYIISKKTYAGTPILVDEKDDRVGTTGL